MTLKTEILDAIDTDGVTIEDVQAQPLKERPAFSIPLAVAWARNPANAPRIEAFAKQARATQDRVMHRLDDEVSKVGGLLVDVLMNDDVESDLMSDLLSSLTGVKD